MKTKDTESEILKAAEQEFMLKGFDGAKTTSIAHAAGVTHAMLHYYFRTKEQLFERILTEKVQLMSESVLAAFCQPGLPLLEELDELHAQGKVEWVDVRMLLLDIISLNVFPFIAYPIIEPILGDIAADRNRFFELRKAENIEMIMRRIKK